MAAHRAGQLDMAATLYRQVLSFSKKQFAPLHMLGVIEGQRGNLAEGIRQIGKALKVNPDSSDAWLNIGRMQAELGDLAAAEKSLRRAVHLDPANALAHNNLAAVFDRQGNLEEALNSIDRALTLAPSDPLALGNRAGFLSRLNRHAEAQVIYRGLIATDEHNAEAWLGLGKCCARKAEFFEAQQALDKARALSPALPELWTTMGGILAEQDRHDEALAAYDRELSINPHSEEAWYQRGAILRTLQRHADAAVSFDKARQCPPHTTRSLTTHFSARLMFCDWSTFDTDQSEIIKRARDDNFSALPLELLRLPLTSGQLHKAARHTAARTFAGIVPQPVAATRSDRIRLAYVSADFGDHPVAELIAGVFEHHDRSRFDLTALSLMKRDGPMRERLATAFDRFIDASELSDGKSVQTLRDLGIDIAIDLNGHTRGGRMQIFAHRAAPVQVGYLGYPGTSGADFMDYLIADRTVIPPEDERCYSEAIAILPDSFMPADSRREISPDTMTRREAGLPDDGFVFCDFNDSTKLTPAVFDVWMSLLRQVEGSVLWLRAHNPTAVANLRREAEQRGVAPGRLVFAPSTPLIADHLARQRLADLFLDTLPYNAHATASDALWAGLPIVTCLGKTFAGRVAASQIKAAGLPELVTHSLPEYEALALKIARNPNLLKALKARLTTDPTALPLFDTARFTRHLEAAYTTMWERACAGLPPAPFAVAPLPR
jgi:predicted O-linked N-acetylglucosamine transferase (SPINDLY family)